MSKELATQASADLLKQLSDSFPQESSFNRINMPRLTFKSQDVMEGKGKNKKVVTEAGTFFVERETEEVNDEGKKVWEKTELGTEVDLHIIYERKQLRHYDEVNEVFTNSPIYDTEDDVVPLFCGKTKVAEGLPKDLKALPQFAYEKDGKTRSSLEDNRILYVLLDGELMQMNLRGSSMYSFLTYARKNAVPTVITHVSSEPQEKGSIEWNQMTFTPVRAITEEEGQKALENVTAIREAVQAEKDFYAAQRTGDPSAVTVTDAAALPAADNDDF